MTEWLNKTKSFSGSTRNLGIILWELFSLLYPLLQFQTPTYCFTQPPLLQLPLASWPCPGGLLEALGPVGRLTQVPEWSSRHANLTTSFPLKICSFWVKIQALRPGIWGPSLFSHLYPSQFKPGLPAISRPPQGKSPSYKPQTQRWNWGF